MCVWEVTSGDCKIKFRFTTPFIKAQFNPRDSSMFLVCPLKHASLLLFNDGSYYELPLEDENDPNVISSFDRRGEHIFCGNSKGKISVFRTQTKELITTFKVTNGNSSAAAIKQIEFARRGDSFLVNTADRIIRVYDLQDILKLGKDSCAEPEPKQKLQDLVNRTLWKKCCFSGDGEFICAGSSRQHSLYIWEKSVGNLVKILHGTKGETLLDVVWHPIRPLIASVSSGVVSIWSQNQVENWSAFAPDFKELDENVEYEERESEFDIEDEDKSIHDTNTNDEEDVDVDLTTVQPVQAFLSSDEEAEDEEKQLLFLTITPEFEDIESEQQQPLPQVDYSTEKTKRTKNNAVPAVNPNDIKPPLASYDINLTNAPSTSSESQPGALSARRQSNSATSVASLSSNASKKR